MQSWRCWCLSVLFTWIGCTKPNPGVCCLDSADCASIGVNDPARPCSDGLACVNNACVVPSCSTDGCSAEAPVCDITTDVCTGCTGAMDCSETSAQTLTIHGGGATLASTQGDGPALILAQIPTTIRDLEISYSPFGPAIEARSTVLLERMKIRGPSGVEVKGPVTMREVEVEAVAAGIGIDVQSGSLTLSHATVSGGETGILAAAGSLLDISSVLVHGTSSAGVRLAGGVNGTINFCHGDRHRCEQSGLRRHRLLVWCSARRVDRVDAGFHETEREYDLQLRLDNDCGAERRDPGLHQHGPVVRR